MSIQKTVRTISPGDVWAYSFFLPRDVRAYSSFLIEIVFFNKGAWNKLNTIWGNFVLKFIFLAKGIILIKKFIACSITYLNLIKSLFSLSCEFASLDEVQLRTKISEQKLHTIEAYDNSRQSLCEIISDWSLSKY